MSSEREGPADVGDRQEHLPVRTVRIPRSSSYDVSDKHNKEQSYQPHQEYGDQYGYSGSYGQHGHQNYQGYSNPTPKQTPQRLRQVVTVTDGSFGNSFEDERDDSSGRARGTRYASYGRGHYHYGSRSAESRYPDEGQGTREGSDQRREQAHHASPEGGYVMANPAMVPPSPSSKRSIDEMTSQNSSEMSTTAPLFKTPSDNNKRSFFHHSRPEDRKMESFLPPDFMPPKKAKSGRRPPRKEKVMTPSSTVPYYNRSFSWNSQDASGAFSSPNRTSSFPDSAMWNDGRTDHPQEYYGGPNREHSLAQDQRSPTSAFRSPRSPSQEQQYYAPSNSGSFSPPDNRSWHSHDGSWVQTPGISPSWSGNASAGRASHQHRERDDTPARSAYRESHSSDSSMRRQVTFESGGEVDGHRRTLSDEKYGHQGHPHYPPPASPNLHPQRSPLVAESAHKRFFSSLPPVTESVQENLPMREDGSSILLLTQPDDRIHLSETLCLIRENIEVFCATAEDVDAPAPGRKHPVSEGQVGLRCIHCSHASKHSDKVKRATCYPSSIKRIYRTVIDMKLDHFQNCPFVPLPLKKRLEELKATNTRSTGTTMQYFVKSATKMGMVDAFPGVRLVAPEPESEVDQKDSMDSLSFSEPMKEDPPVALPANAASAVLEEREPGPSGPLIDSRGTRSFESRDQSLSEQSSIEMEVQPIDSNEEIPEFTGLVGLALPEDHLSLSPLRCFLRQNVCAFSATDEDIAVRTPTTFSVVKGQVGIACIHCLKVPARERSNRAVCFPFSIGRIYQSVADIQRFHLNECKMIPEDVRAKFVELQSNSSKGSKGLATRQYWVSSAKKIGLVDTSQGIRFSRDPSVPPAPAVSLDILAQVASNVTTVNRPLVFPEDQGTIAEFLYVVMAQLQPCRFTEADRNKRRLKNVGCIGVECKHCAGQVESRKFFWSSVNAVESNFVSVHTHMMECKSVPQPLKEYLKELKAIRKEQTQKLKIGSQKAFFTRVWERLHAEEPVESSGEAPAEGNGNARLSPQGVESVSDKMAVVSV